MSAVDRRFGNPLLVKGCGLVLFVLLSLPVKAAEREAAPDYCPLGAAVATDEYRRLALIVGVGQYQSDQVPDLPGPAGDARRIYHCSPRRTGMASPKRTSACCSMRRRPQPPSSNASRRP